MERPARGEYADYYHLYVSRVPDGDIVDILDAQRDEFESLLRGLEPGRGRHRYADEKWSIAEVAGHIVDTERLFGSRALAFARGDKTPLPAFEQDDYVARANFDKRSLADLADEFQYLRNSLLALFRSFDDEIWARRGTASGFEFTVRAVPYILAGHLKHHVGVLQERYL
jgi:hypothetical protein